MSDEGKQEFIKGWKAGAVKARRRVRKWKLICKKNERLRKNQQTFFDGSAVWDVK